MTIASAEALVEQAQTSAGATLFARPALEFASWGPITNIGLGMEAVRTVNRGRGRGPAALLIDAWHFWRDDSTWERLERVTLADVADVQFANGDPPPRRTENETTAAPYWTSAGCATCAYCWRPWRRGR